MADLPNAAAVATDPTSGGVLLIERESAAGNAPAFEASAPRGVAALP